MGVRGLGTGPGNSLRCMDIRWDYWDMSWRFSEDLSAWDCMYFCRHVRMFFFSVIRRGAGVEHPKKVSLSPFGELNVLTCN